MMNSRLRWKPENVERIWIRFAYSKLRGAWNNTVDSSFTSNPCGVDVIAPIDPGLRRQVDASRFDRNYVLIPILVKIAWFNRGHEIEFFRFPRSHQLKRKKEIKILEKRWGIKHFIVQPCIELQGCSTHRYWCCWDSTCLAHILTDCFPRYWFHRFQ